MAERRMFARSIVLSDAFLDMPMSARCLYFTLGMVADDDGFVGSPKTTMRMCGASQEDLEVLLQKRYILGFQSGVVVVKHWKINNYLRSDRHSCTTYVEEMSTLTVDGKGSYTEKDRTSASGKQPKGNVDTEVGIPSVNHVVDERYTQDRIDKDSIGKVNISTSSKDSVLVGAESTDGLVLVSPEDENKEKNEVPYKEIIAYWNKTTAGRLPQITKISKTRQSLIKQRWADYRSDVYRAIDKCMESDFLSGRNGKWDGCFFDWLFKASNMPKVLEGNYDNKKEEAVRRHKDYSDISAEDLEEEFHWK